jgi:protein phosphatase PTC7
VLTYEAAKAHTALAKNPLASPNPKKLIQVAQENTKLPGASTIVIIELLGTKLSAASIGDSGFRVVRDGKVLFASPPQEHYFNCPYQLGYEPLNKDVDLAIDAQEFEVPVQPGDLVIAGSDGLFDNIFDENIELVVSDALAKVAGAGALSAARAVSEALVVEARKNAEDPIFESPFAIEAAKAKAVGTAASSKQKGALGAFSALTTSVASAISGKKLGGKMDDITVVVGAVVAAERVSNQMQKEADTIRKRATGEEAKTLRSVNLRQQMDFALSQEVSRKEAALKAEAEKPPEFSKLSIEKMDAPTVRRLLEERGLPTSGKIDRLRERLSRVKAK